MLNKLIVPFILIIFVTYFVINPSYTKSIEAKYYYEMGRYSKAYAIAKDAFSLDVYNRMASTVMAQSLISLKYESFNNDAKKYMKTINTIATHEVISDADKAKIRTMCNIVTGAYKKLAPSVVTDIELIKTASKYNKNFEKLLEKVDR